MIVVGLTGGIGAGKSTFAAMLGELGAAVVDVDAIGREVIAPGTEGAAAVARRFGTDDRRELARIVFREPSARRDLESISWPLIEERLREIVAAFSGEVLVLDMAVLPQGLGKGIYGPVVTVEAPDDVRLARLIERGMDAEDAKARMNSQTSEQERRAIADIVVVNDGSPEALRQKAGEVLAGVRGTVT